MTNNQCYSYGIMAIKNLKENNLKITPDSFYFELYRLWDIYSENQIEQIVKILEMNDVLL